MRHASSDLISYQSKLIMLNLISNCSKSTSFYQKWLNQSTAYGPRRSLCATYMAHALVMMLLYGSASVSKIFLIIIHSFADVFQLFPIIEARPALQ